MNFSEKLKELRIENKLTQEQLANIIHVSRSAIAKWENGLGLPNEESLELLMKCFNVDKNYLFTLPEKTEELIVNKNDIIHKQKFKIIIVSVLLVLLTILSTISFILVYNNKTIYFEEESKVVNIDLINYSNSNTCGEYEHKAFDNKNGYNYQKIYFERIEFSKNSDIYFLEIKNSITPGKIGYMNGSKEYYKKALLNKVIMNVNFLDQENVNQIFDYPNNFDRYVNIKSKYSDNEDLILHDTITFNSISFNKINNGYITYYKYNEEDFLYSQGKKIANYSRVLSKDFIPFYYYEMTKYGSNKTLDMYTYFIFEVNKKEISSFSFSVNLKTYNKNKVTTQNTLFNCTI